LIKITALASSSKGNCYHIDDGSFPLLIECGISYKKIQQGIGFKMSSLKGCLVSHEHMDHCKASPELMKAGIDIYTGQGTIDARGYSGHRIKAVEALKQFTVGSWTILPFDVEHDAAEPLGFLLQNSLGDRLLYATDTYYLKYRFERVNYLMLECNYDEALLNNNVLNGDIHPSMKKRIRRSHFSLDNVKGFLRANDLSGIREIWLIHLSEQNSNTERFKKEIQQLTGKPVIVPGE
jgi:phosphoribosyl 1,2-cyclic phosphodiesterase